MLTAGIVLMLFAVAGAGIVAYTYEETAQRIAENERQTLLRRLNQVVPAEAYDNAIHEDTIAVSAPELGSEQPLTVYRARKSGEPVAAILTVVAPHGYSGEIKLLVGVYASGEAAGVRVVSHQETPGLGDAIEAERSSWIEQFKGKALGAPPAADWKVAKDGGEFDRITGATISARAVVDAVKRALQYFAEHRKELFAE
ncbi:MAG: electron transport complex subunit RsxG [Anaerolineae bacterium]|nr:electron transport complex subunit RsxG [Anaerolineae bacterium]